MHCVDQQCVRWQRACEAYFRRALAPCVPLGGPGHRALPVGPGSRSDWGGGCRAGAQPLRWWWLRPPVGDGRSQRRATGDSWAASEQAGWAGVMSERGGGGCGCCLGGAGSDGGSLPVHRVASGNYSVVQALEEMRYSSRQATGQRDPTERASKGVRRRVPGQRVTGSRP